MGVVSYGPLVDGVRGSIGGTTFGRCSAGSTARRKPRRAYPGLVSQQNSKLRLSNGAQIWRTLSDAYRLGWENYGASVTLTDSLSHDYHLTGFQAFVRWYAWQARTTQASPGNQAPGALGLPVVPTLTWEVAGSPLSLRISACSPALVLYNFLTVVGYEGDARRVFNRRRLRAYGVEYFGIPLPWTIIYGIDAGFTPGQTIRFHIEWRFQDADKRLSTIQRFYYDRIIA